MTLGAAPALRGKGGVGGRRARAERGKGGDGGRARGASISRGFVRVKIANCTSRASGRQRRRNTRRTAPRSTPAGAALAGVLRTWDIGTENSAKFRETFIKICAKFGKKCREITFLGFFLPNNAKTFDTILLKY